MLLDRVDSPVWPSDEVLVRAQPLLTRQQEIVGPRNNEVERGGYSMNVW